MYTLQIKTNGDVTSHNFESIFELQELVDEILQDYILTPREIAEETGKTLHTVYRWLWDNKIPHSKDQQGNYKINREDFNKFVAKRK